MSTCTGSTGNGRHAGADCCCATPMICWRCARPSGRPRTPFRRSRQSWPKWDSNSKRPRHGSCTCGREARESTSSASTTAGGAAVPAGRRTSNSSLAGHHGRRRSTPATECVSSRHGTGCAGRSSKSLGTSTGSSRLGGLLPLRQLDRPVRRDHPTRGTTSPAVDRRKPQAMALRTAAVCRPPGSLRTDQPQRNHRCAPAEPTVAPGSRMPAVKNVGEPCAGEPHARIDGGREETGTSRPSRAEPGASRLPDHPPLKNRRTRIWIGLIVACVVVWLIADSQGPDLLAFNAHGAFLHVLEVAWVVSLFGFILLVLFGVFAVVRSRLRSRALSGGPSSTPDAQPVPQHPADVARAWLTAERTTAR